jgi:hypothetical protein
MVLAYESRFGRFAGTARSYCHSACPVCRELETSITLPMRCVPVDFVYRGVRRVLPGVVWGSSVGMINDLAIRLSPMDERLAELSGRWTRNDALRGNRKGSRGAPGDHV